MQRREDEEQDPLFYDLPEDEEQEPLFYDLPLSRLLSWNRWWHLTAQAIRLVFQKRSWGVTGPYLKKKGILTDRLILLRTNWSARGQELKYIKHLGDCDSHDRSECRAPYFGKKRRYKSPPVLRDTSALPMPRLADHIDTEMVPLRRKTKKKQSARDQSLRHPSLPRADSLTNTMRLWESLK